VPSLSRTYRESCAAKFCQGGHLLLQPSTPPPSQTMTLARFGWRRCGAGVAVTVR
jgi:hypothetical protein